MAKPHRPQILVVDDEEDTCLNLKDILDDLGYRVDTAREGGSALELVRRNAYDVALLDLKMPGMDGLTLYREIKKLRAGTVALLVTAYASGATAEAALGAGAWRVVPKPVHVPRLLDLVGQALGQPLVLVVDDDHDLCENLWQILRDRGYRVCLAHDAAGAAERLKDADFTIVLIDMKIPGGDGAEVFRMVRRANPGSRTVLITGCPGETDRLVGQVLAEGADGVHYKPFDVPRLLEQLERLGRAHGGPPGGEAAPGS